MVGRLPGAVANLDATVICEAPNLTAVQAEIASRLSRRALGTREREASTNEGMGAIGRGEGIACVAIALVGFRGGRARIKLPLGWRLTG